MNKQLNGQGNLLPVDGEVYYEPCFFAKEKSDALFSELLENIQWGQEPIQMFGRSIMQPRLTAWYGDSGKSYRYSGLTMQPLGWTPALEEIKAKIEQFSQARFTGALLNQYRDGRDSMGWHRDNEKELGPDPVIASVSFGAVRTFQLRHCQDRNLKLSIDLEHGSFLLMKGATQHHWLHAIPKTRQLVGTRINITFRALR